MTPIIEYSISRIGPIALERIARLDPHFGTDVSFDAYPPHWPTAPVKAHDEVNSYFGWLKRADGSFVNVWRDDGIAYIYPVNVFAYAAGRAMCRADPLASVRVVGTSWR